MNWRVKLRSLLVVGQPVPAIELFDAICEDIPLHHATRRQAAQRKGRKAKPVIRMRWFAFAQEVSKYRIFTDPPVMRGRGKEMTGATIITPYADPCPRCGVLVSCHRARANCTPCWNWHKGKARRVLREDAIPVEENRDHEAVHPLCPSAAGAHR